MEKDIWNAIGDSDKEALKALLEMHPEIVSATAKYGATPLSLAAEVGDVAIIGTLLEYGANPNELINKVSPINGRADMGATPLMYANTVDSIRTLASAGADVNAKDASGRTVFARIGMLFDPKLVSEIHRHGGNPEESELVLLIEQAKEELMYRKKQGTCDTSRVSDLIDFVEFAEKLR
jgi:hypothetical protein